MSFKQQQQMNKTKKKLSKVSLGSPGWYRTIYVDQAVLDLTGIHLTLFPSTGLRCVHYTLSTMG